MLRNIKLLYIHNFLTDFLPQWPYLVIYFTQITHSYTVTTSVLAVETLSAALMDIPTGVFSDRLGRRITLFLGSFCAAASAACYGFAHELTLLYLGAFLNGCSQCLFSGNNNALLYESLKSAGLEKKYHHYRGGAGSMFQLGLCLSAFSASFISGYGLRLVFFAALVSQTLAAVLSLFFTVPPVHVEGEHKGWGILKTACLNTWRNPRLLLLVAGRAISYGVDEARFKFQTAFINLLWPTWGVGIYRGINHALAFIGFRFAGRILDRVNNAWLLAVREVYWFGIGMAAVFFKNVYSPFILNTGAPFFGVGDVALDHLMQKEFSDAQRATMGSVSSFASSIVFAVTSLALGIVSDRYGLTVGVGFGFCLGLVALPIYLRLYRRDF